MFWFLLAVLCYLVSFVLIVGLIRASARADAIAERHRAEAEAEALAVFHSLCDVTAPCDDRCAAARVTR